MSPDLSFPKLNESNYHEWKIYMTAVLTTKGLWEVTCGCERHPGNGEGTKKTRDWRTKCQLARAEIILRVSPSQLAHCSHDDPMMIWNALANVHSSRGRSTITFLRRQLHQLHLERGESISAYVARARHLAFLIDEAGSEITDIDLIFSITSGLPRSYDPFLISLDTLPDSDYTLDSIIGRLANEHQRQAAQTPSKCIEKAALTAAPIDADDSMSVTTSSRRCDISQITCYCCAQKGHYQANCPQKPDPALAVDDLTF